MSSYISHISDRALLHWANIVGASHSKDYAVWQYGGYASAGVKEVCEFGYPRKIEEEMRQHVSTARVFMIITKTFKLIMLFAIKQSIVYCLEIITCCWLHRYPSHDV